MGIFVETTSDSVIVAAIDFSEPSRAALVTAFALGTLSGATVRAVHVVDVLAGDSAFWDFFEKTDKIKDEVIELARKELEAFVVESLGEDHGVELEVRFGRPTDNLAEAADAENVELLVMGTTGLGRVEAALFGSTASHLLREATTPILLLDEEPLQAAPRTILAPIDFSECSELALSHAARIARISNGEVIAYNTMRADPVRYSPYFPTLPSLSEEEIARAKEVRKKRIEELIEKLEIGDVTVASDVEEAESIPDAILEEAAEQGADLICLGSHGRKGMDRWVLGSSAEAVVKRAKIPVLVVRR